MTLRGLTLLVLGCLSLVQTGATSKPTAQRALGPDEGWACDVVFPDAHTIVIADWDNNARVSTDGGTTWETHAMHTWSRELALGPGGTIWSLYFWRGIHEASSAELVYSADVGRTWTKIAWPVERALPSDLICDEGQEPVLLADDGTLWRHTSGSEETLASWKKLGTPNPEHAGVCALARADTLYVATASDVWRSRDGGTSWSQTGWVKGIVALTVVPRARPEDPERVAAATRAGVVYTVELGKQTWKKLGALPEHTTVLDIAASTDGIWFCGESLGGSLGGRMDASGRWHALEGLAGAQSVAVRRAPDGRIWSAGYGVYVAGQTSWERVWPK